MTPLKELISIVIYCKMLFIPVMQSWIFSIITPVFSVTLSFRNNTDILVCSSFLIIINTENSAVFDIDNNNHDTFFSGFFDEYKVKKKQNLFEIFCNTIKVFAVHFDQFNVSSLN